MRLLKYYWPSTYEANSPPQKRKRQDYDTVEVDVGLVRAGEQPCMVKVAGAQKRRRRSQGVRPMARSN